MTKPSASLHEMGLFSAAETKRRAKCKYNVELLAAAAALRNLKLLVGSGCLVFQKGIAGIDSLDKHVA